MLQDGESDRIELVGQVNVVELSLPVSLGLSVPPDELRSVEHFESVVVENEEFRLNYSLVSQTRASEQGQSELDVYSMMLNGERRCIRSTAVVDPLPLLVVLGGVALGGIVI